MLIHFTQVNCKVVACIGVSIIREVAGLEPAVSEAECCRIQWGRWVGALHSMP